MLTPTPCTYSVEKILLLEIFLKISSSLNRKLKFLVVTLDKSLLEIFVIFMMNILKDMRG